MLVEIRPDEVTKLIEDPLEHYYKSFKSSMTAETQTRALRKVLCEFLGPVLAGDPKLIKHDRNLGKAGVCGIVNRYSIADFEARAREFVARAKEDPKWAEAVIVKIMHKLEERTKLDKTNPEYLSKGAARNYYFPIQRLLESGSIELPWKRIRRNVPKQTGHGGRAWERKEIGSMLEHCNSEEKPLVVIPAASGIREGGLWFRWGDIFTVYQHEGRYLWEPQDVTESVTANGTIVCGMIHIYAESQDDDDYFGLITPECLKIIEEYRSFWANTWGKPPTPKDPFFRKHGPAIRQLKEAGIRHRMEAIQRRCGLRTKLPPNTRRHEVQPFTGFRKFFDKATKQAQSTNSLLGKLILNEKMMGHDGLIRLNRNYFRELVSELIEEYLPAVPHLTINDAERKQLQLDQALKEKLQAEAQKMQYQNALAELEGIKAWKVQVDAQLQRDNMYKYGKTDLNS